jgi:hypothetical protein
MNKKPSARRASLRFEIETIRALQANELRGVAGGSSNEPFAAPCEFSDEPPCHHVHDMQGQG